MIQYADFMAFPVPQDRLFAKKGCEFDPRLALDVCQLTSVPPNKKTLPEIREEHYWYVRMIESEKERLGIDLKCRYGIQFTPPNVNHKDIDTLKNMGIDFMGLAYDHAGQYGGGFANPEIPLTISGESLIMDMARAEMVLDLSHASHQTARDAIQFIKRHKMDTRVVATHTGCYDVYQHNRNLPDDVLVGIADLGGIVGLASLTWLLHESDNSIEPFLAHLDYLVELIDEDQVCLGTDSIYGTLLPKQEEMRLAMMNKMLDPEGKVFRARIPEVAPELNRPSKMLVLEDLFLHRGWSGQKAEKILGGNLIKFLSSP